jgi:hypothetical protein
MVACGLLFIMLTSSESIQESISSINLISTPIKIMLFANIMWNFSNSTLGVSILPQLLQLDFLPCMALYLNPFALNSKKMRVFIVMTQAA